MAGERGLKSRVVHLKVLGVKREVRMMTNQKHAGSVKTVWALRTYDVWGNAKDGYEVNDTYSAGEITLFAPVTVYNVGTPQEFKAASLTDRQIKKAFGVTCQIETDGDDLHITVDRRRDSYPIGEMFCTSHKSLSPIRK
jgi:hypothetical protein